MEKKVSELFLSVASKNVPVLFMQSREAEAQLFSNTFLALRVAFFNEVDSYSEVNNLSSLNLINGISLDPRIEITIIILHLIWGLLSAQRYQTTSLKF